MDLALLGLKNPIPKGKHMLIVKSELREVLDETLRDFFEGRNSVLKEVDGLVNALLGTLEERFPVTDDEYLEEDLTE